MYGIVFSKRGKTGVGEESGRECARRTKLWTSGEAKFALLMP